LSGSADALRGISRRLVELTAALALFGGTWNWLAFLGY